MRGKKRAVCLCILLLIVPALLLFFAFCLPAQYGETYLAALTDKAAALDKAAPPKIVLIGGSGAAFGFDCERLEEQFPGYRAVNFGLYAGLGTAVMLELALPALNGGDIVIFSPELSKQTLSDWFDALSMWQAAEENPALLLRLDASRWQDMLAAFPSYAARKARFAMLGTSPGGSGIYARSSFTEKGDVQFSQRPANQMPGRWDMNTPLRFDGAWPSEDFIKRVNDFTEACRIKRVRVYFRFCPMNAAALQPGERERMEAFTERLRASLACELLGSAERALMEPGWFYDTDFHLNGAGAALNTALLAEELKAVMGDENPVTIEMPVQPESTAFVLWEGNIEDEDCFLYENRDGNAVIVGLSNLGTMRESLTVPVSHEGMNVVSFDVSVFAGNVYLKELTLQNNIRIIPDGAFSGCASLKTILLFQDDPGLCSVGEGLLDGTEAVVAVPKDRYGSYCTNYFWAPHAARLRPMEENTTIEQEAAQSAESPASIKELSPAAKIATSIRYIGNGGTLRGQAGDTLTREITFVHIRENTLPGTVWFEWADHVLIGWNTVPDGSGLSVGLGSRYDPAQGDQLYAQWLPCASDTDFDWETDGKTASITGYHGTGETCVIPLAHEGLPVRSIRAGAFQKKEFALLVLSPALRTVEKNAFAFCAFDTVILYDSLEIISDGSFSGCSGPAALRVNAASSPVYSGSYFDTFQDKYDYLLSLADKRKIVLSSGSSGRYGYDSPLLKEAFPDWEPVNMGVYAYTNALPQLALILNHMEAGDILLYAPEFDAIKEQFCVSNRLDTGFWAMMESNYDAAAELDMNAFFGVFDSFGEYLHIRSKMPRKNYSVSPAHYDDDGNSYAFSTYNPYGDFILPRPNGETDERLRHNIADYTVNSFPIETIQSLNGALAPFAEKGVAVYFSYSPRNNASLTEESTPEARQALHQWLKENLDVPLISEMEDYLLPGRYFWLIDSHTGTEGARIRTEHVIQDLQKHWKGNEKP
ncbi:MAG: leucine-rich repeat protein [Clostridia bacterium]|nr:leucine-rich repeat protein [Clostridia bacterium]